MFFANHENRLKVNGSEYPKSYVLAIMCNLKLVQEKYPNSFYELVQKCRNPVYDVRENEVLIKLNLMNNKGQVHDVTRDIVLSSLQGDDVLQLHSPIAENNFITKVNTVEMQDIKVVTDLEPYLGRFISFQCISWYVTPNELYLGNNKMYGYIRHEPEKAEKYLLTLVCQDKDIFHMGLNDNKLATIELKLSLVEDNEVQLIKEAIQNAGYTFLSSGQLTFTETSIDSANTSRSFKI